MSVLRDGVDVVIVFVIITRGNSNSKVNATTTTRFLIASHTTNLEKLPKHNDDDEEDDEDEDEDAKEDLDAML